MKKLFMGLLVMLGAYSVDAQAPFFPNYVSTTRVSSSGISISGTMTRIKTLEDAIKNVLTISSLSPLQAKVDAMQIKLDSMWNNRFKVGSGLKYDYATKELVNVGALGSEVQYDPQAVVTLTASVTQARAEVVTLTTKNTALGVAIEDLKTRLAAEEAKSTSLQNQYNALSGRLDRLKVVSVTTNTITTN